MDRRVSISPLLIYLSFPGPKAKGGEKGTMITNRCNNSSLLIYFHGWCWRKREVNIKSLPCIKIINKVAFQCHQLKKEKFNIVLFSAYICKWRWNIAWRVEILNTAVFIVLIINFWSRASIIWYTFCLKKFPQNPTEKTQNVARFIKYDYCFPFRPFCFIFQWLLKQSLKFQSSLNEFFEHWH